MRTHGPDSPARADGVARRWWMGGHGTRAGGRHGKPSRGPDRSPGGGRLWNRYGGRVPRPRAAPPAWPRMAWTGPAPWPGIMRAHRVGGRSGTTRCRRRKRP